MAAPEAWSADLQGKIARAFRDLVAIEAGEIMNPDEGRAVGHYWLRTPELAPDAPGQWNRDVNQTVTPFPRKNPHGHVACPYPHPNPPTPTPHRG